MQLPLLETIPTGVLLKAMAAQPGSIKDRLLAEACALEYNQRELYDFQLLPRGYEEPEEEEELVPAGDLESTGAESILLAVLPQDEAS